MKSRARIAVAAGVLALGGGGYFVYREVVTGREAVRAAERDRLAQDFAEVGQCFFGTQPTADAITSRKITDIASRLDGTPADWPFECSARVDRFRTRVETAHHLDPAGATRLSSALYKLDEALRDGTVQLPDLGDQLREVWTLADACGIRAGTPESPAPPLPRELPPGAAKLPLTALTPLGGGPSWQFLGRDERGLSQCAIADSKLVCTRVALGDAKIDRDSLRSIGTWSSPRFILLTAADRSVWLLADHKLEPLTGGLRPRDSHVGATGDVTALTQKELHVMPRDPSSKPIVSDTAAAVAKADPDARDFFAAALLGPRLLVARPSGELLRFDIDEHGALSHRLELDARVAPRPDFSLSTCRAGENDAVLLPDRIVFETAKGIVERPGEGALCSASGVIWTTSRGCSPAGCVDHPEEVFRSKTGRNDLPRFLQQLPRDRVGAADTIAWQARLTGGLLVRGNAADISTSVVVATAEEAAEIGAVSQVDLLNGDSPTVDLGVYGGARGGVVLYRKGRGPQLGVAVDAAGQVSPLAVEGL